MNQLEKNAINEAAKAHWLFVSDQKVIPVPVWEELDTSVKAAIIADMTASVSAYNEYKNRLGCEFVTFGQDHIHMIEHAGRGKIVNKNCVAIVDSRQHAFDLFGNKFSTSYPQFAFNMRNMRDYPDGFVILTTATDGN